jgi:uncharacterized membrane protein HdeD (DUF308 family)
MYTEATESPLAQGERILSRVWKLIALRGAMAIGFGIVLLVWPDIGLSAMVGVIGVLAIATGVLTGVAAWSLPGSESTPYRIWMALNGLFGIAVGAAMLIWPDLSAKGLLYAIAIWAIVVGVTELVGGLVLPLTPMETFLTVLGGIVMAAFGVIMFVEPSDGAVALLALVAALALVRGIFDIGLAVELRDVAEKLKARTRQPISAKPVTHG